MSYVRPKLLQVMMPVSNLSVRTCASIATIFLIALATTAKGQDLIPTSHKQAIAPAQDQTASSSASNATGDHPSSIPEGIVIIGDSHLVGAYGDSLHQHFADLKTLPVESVAICAGRIGSFLGTGSKTHCGYRIRKSAPPSNLVKTTLFQAKHATTAPLSEHLKHIKPKILVVSVGMNYGLNPINSIAQEVRTLGEFANAQGIAQVYLVGPPSYYKSYHVHAGFEQGIQLAKNVKFIKATGFNESKPMTKGHLHFGPRKAAQLGDYVFGLIRESLEIKPEKGMAEQQP